METIKVTVADQSSGVLKPVLLKDRAAERYRAIDANLRPIWPHILTGADTSGLIGRRASANDAQEALAFLVSQLAYTESLLLTRYFKKMQYKDVLAGCISFEAGEWATSVEYEVYEPKGNAKFISSASDDIPFTDVGYARKSIPIHHAAVGYQFSQQELRATAFLKRPLPERRLAAAIEAYERKLNVLALTGATDKNMTGLINNANVTHATRASGKDWHGTASGAEIAADLAVAMNAIFAASGYNVVPNAVGIPPTPWEYVNSTPMSTTYPNMTILEWLSKNNLAKSQGVDCQFFPLFDAAGAGASASDRVVVYDRSPDTMVFHIPMPLRFLAPQLEGLYVRVPGEFRVGPVEIRRSTNAYYIDGV